MEESGVEVMWLMKEDGEGGEVIVVGLCLGGEVGVDVL